MCKHVAAVLYGVGARLDDKPELLFRLRQVEEKELLAGAAKGLPLAAKKPAAKKVLAGEDLSGLFGLELADAEKPARARKTKPAAGRQQRLGTEKKKAGRKKVKR